MGRKSTDYGLQSTAGIFLVFLFLSFLTLALENKGVFNGLEAFVQGRILSIRQSLYQTRRGLSASTGVLTEYKRLNKQNAELEAKVGFLTSRVVSLRGAEEENKRLKSILGTTLPVSWRLEEARVISRSGDELNLKSISNNLPQIGAPGIIGEKDEPQVGDRGVYIGRVDKIIGAEIVAILPSHTLSKIGVIVRDRDTGERKASGILIGRGGSALLDQVLSSENLSEGDIVVTSGEGNLPSELLIGTVSRVFQKESSPWKQGEVALAIKADNLDYIFFVSNY
ncbi:MAG: rod shape-determining protein MreC [bacterium]|nr:rod shape-determining protein MreC [bacterium]